MRTTIDIPDAIFRQIKTATAADGETLRAFMLRSVIRELEDPALRDVSTARLAEPDGGRDYSSRNEEVTRVEKTPLSSWSLQKLEYDFQLERQTDHDLLVELTTNPPMPNEQETVELEQLRQLLERKSVGWNEEELKFHFLGPLFRLVNFDGQDCNLFAGRPIKAVVSDLEIGGVVDAMFASGRYDPIEPYFCFHEYKRQTGNNSEPAAQVLAAMVAARELNADERPVYGAYVAGRNWYFLSLAGDRQIYGYGPSYDAGSDGIMKVFGILRRIRDWGRELTNMEKY